MPPKPKTEQERKRIRTAILDAARELFIERGVEAVTMREIARRVDYSPTAIYLHFKDKESLIRELCDTDFLELADTLQEIGRISDPLERLYQLGLGYVRFAVEHPNHYRLMFMTPQILKNQEGSAIEAGNPEQDAYAFLRATVEEVYFSGCFRAELDDQELIAQTLWAGLHGVCSLEITKKNDHSLNWRAFESRIEMMQQSLMHGLLKNNVQ